MQETQLENLLIVEGINAQGYGSIPKLVMKDRRLTPQAKAIYAYFCSYAGCGSTAFPKVSQIIYDLNMSNKTYYKHFELLTKYGYVSVIRTRKDGSKFDNNIYKLNWNPKKTVVEKLHNGEKNNELPTENIQKKEENVDKSVDNSHSVDSPSRRNSMTQISITQNSTTNINNINKNIIKNNINYNEWSKDELEYINNWMYETNEN